MVSNIYNNIRIILDQSYLEILIDNRKINSSKTGMSIRSKKAFLSEGKNINFQNSKIQFYSINVKEDVFDVYILYKGQKIKNTNSNEINYYRILAKDIGVIDDFKEMNFNVVNNISLIDDEIESINEKKALDRVVEVLKLAEILIRNNDGINRKVVSRRIVRLETKMDRILSERKKSFYAMISM
jgi:hypothetical protein